MGVDAIVGLVSLFGPKLFDLAKGLFNKKNSPEQTLNTLATTNPDALAKYTDALANLINARVKQFNQDVYGTVATWVATWRASIRPAVVTVAFIHVAYITFRYGPSAISLIPEWFRYIYEIAIGSWFGDRWKSSL